MRMDREDDCDLVEVKRGKLNVIRTCFFRETMPKRGKPFAIPLTIR